MSRTPETPLPDYLRPGLALLFVGINPGLRSAALGHHFAGINNPFWKLVVAAGIVPEPIDYAEDHRVLEWGIGLTNIVARPTASAGELTRADYEAGRQLLRAKILRNRPRRVAFVGITAFRQFFNERGRVECGPQAVCIGDSAVHVLPNPSGRNQHYTFEQMLALFRALAEHVRGGRSDEL